MGHWNKIRKRDSWVYAQFHDSHNVEFSVKHLSFPFITQILTDILNFDVTFLDDSGKLIEF